MTERLQSSPDLWKLKSDKSKEFLKRYEEQREKYYKTKNKNDKITEEQRNTIDAELNAKINQLSQQEKAKKSEAIAEISDIKSGLDALNTRDVENLDIANFEFSDSIWFWSVQAIREQAQLYVTFNEWINAKVASLSNLYNQFTQVVNRFNKEREDDTRRSWDSDYEQYVDTINQKIQEYKQLFEKAETELTNAINQSDRAWERLNSAPDDLRKTEWDNQWGTEWQFKDQEKQHINKLNALWQQWQKLDQSAQNLWQAQNFLNAYSNQLVQVTDNLTVQKTQIDNTLSEWDRKKIEFQKIINTVCTASWVNSFTDEELKNLLTNTENFIQNLLPQERAQAALNLYNQYWEKLSEYIQITERYWAWVQQREQLTQWLNGVENRQTQVIQSKQEVANQQQIVNNETIANNARIEEVKWEMAESKDQYEQSVEYYHKNMDDIDTLDYEMSSVILDTDISNHWTLDSIASQVKSFNWMKVSAKWWRERAWDSTIGMVWKWLRNYVLEPVKDALLFLPNFIQSIGENNPSIGNSWLFKAINGPLQITTGITEWVCELANWLVQMVEQPMATLSWLWQLIWRDAVTWERSFGTAWDAWTNFGKALIAYDEWWEWNDWRALGKWIANIWTLFIPFAWEVWAAANTAKVARAIGWVSKTRAAMIWARDFVGRTGGKMAKWTKNIGSWLRKTVRHPIQTVKKWLWYAVDGAKWIVNKWKAVAEEVRQAWGVTNYAKNWLTTAWKSISEWYHNVWWVKWIAKDFAETTTWYVYVKWAWRLIKWEPLFWKKFPSLKNLPEKRLQMEQRLQKLRWTNWAWWELNAMYQKVSKYLDKDGNFLEWVQWAEIPVRDWWKIADYQSALQEVRVLESTIAQYKHVETSLTDEAWNLTKLWKAIQDNPKFWEAMEKMLADPSKAQEIFAEFKKENPKVDMSALEDMEIFRDWNNIFRIKDGELVNWNNPAESAFKKIDKKDIQPEGLQVWDRINWLWEDVKVTSRIEEWWKVSYEFEYAKWGKTKVTAEEMWRGWDYFSDVRRPQKVEWATKWATEWWEVWAETRAAEWWIDSRLETPGRTVQDIFDDLSLEKIDAAAARRELALRLHPDRMWWDGTLFRDAMEDLRKIVDGKHPEFEWSHDWSKVSWRSSGVWRWGEARASEAWRWAEVRASEAWRWGEARASEAWRWTETVNPLDADVVQTRLENLKAEAVDKQLQANGLKVESAKAELSWDMSRSKVAKAEAEALEAEVKVAKAEAEALEAEVKAAKARTAVEEAEATGDATKIKEAKAEVAKTEIEAKVAKADADVAKAEAKVAKADADVVKAEARVNALEEGAQWLKWIEQGAEKLAADATEAERAAAELERAATEAERLAVEAEEAGIRVERVSIYQNNIEWFSFDNLWEEARSFMTEGFWELWKPKHTVDLWEHKLYLTDVMIDSKWRKFAIWYTETWEVRLFYRSNSEGVWRASPGKDSPSRFSKWEAFIENCSYESTTMLEPKFNKFLDEVTSSSVDISPMDYAYNLDKRWWLFHRKKWDNFAKRWKSMKQEFEVVDAWSKGHFGVEWRDWIWRHSGDAEDVISRYRSMKVDWLDMKSMTRQPGKKYTFQHEYLGECEVDVVEMTFNWEKINVHFAHSVWNNPEQIFISRMEYADVEMNSFGCASRQIASPMVNKPMDYIDQVPRWWNWDIYWGYKDIRWLYQDMPIIREYKDFLRRPSSEQWVWLWVDKARLQMEATEARATATRAREAAVEARTNANEARAVARQRWEKVVEVKAEVEAKRDLLAQTEAERSNLQAAKTKRDAATKELYEAKKARDAVRTEIPREMPAPEAPREMPAPETPREIPAPETPKYELKTMKKEEVNPSTLQEGDTMIWNWQEMKVSKRVENEWKVSYELEYTEAGKTENFSMTADDLVWDWGNVWNIRRPQEMVQVRGMNGYFRENVASCKWKDIYINWNKYTASVDSNGALHLKYTWWKRTPPKGANGESLQDITVSSFDELFTKWEASPISDWRALSWSRSAKARELTLSESENVEFWNKMRSGEKERTRNNAKQKSVAETPVEPVAETPVIRDFSPEWYKSPQDTFDELLMSDEWVTVDWITYKLKFNRHETNLNKERSTDITLTMEKDWEVIATRHVKSKTDWIPGDENIWNNAGIEMRGIIEEVRWKYVENYNRSMPVRQGEWWAVVQTEKAWWTVVSAERPVWWVPATVEKPIWWVPATVEKPVWWVPAVVEKPWVPVVPEIKPPLIPNVPLWVSGAVVAILANKDHEKSVHIDVPGTTWFEWTPQDQQEVSEFQEFLSRSPSSVEIKDFIRNNKDAFKKLILVKDWEKGWANINFDLLNSLIEQWKFDGLDGNIKEQLKHDIIRYIGLWDVLEEGTTFTVTSVDWKKRTGKVVNNRAVDENGKYIPIFQWDHVESDALWFLDPIYPYDNAAGNNSEIDPDVELENNLEQI